MPKEQEVEKPFSIMHSNGQKIGSLSTQVSNLNLSLKRVKVGECWQPFQWVVFSIK